MKILFIGARLFDDVAFYLRKKEIISILTESNKDSPNLELANETFIVPRGMEKPTEIAISENVDAVIPLIGIDIPLMEVAIMKEKLESNYDIPVIASNSSTIAISSDKIKTKEFFIENEFITPNHLIVKNFKDFLNKFNNKNETMEFPLVLKQAIGQGGKNIKIARDFEDVENYLFKHGQTLCESFIDGFEISIEVLCGKHNNKKEYFAIIPVYKGKTNLEGIHPLNNVRSAPCDIEGLKNEDIKEMAIEIVKKLNCEGIVDVDFIYSQNEHKLFAIEINTRPSGTRYLTAAASGINPLTKLIDMANNNFSIVSMKNQMKDFYALEIPIGNYEGPLCDEPLKSFNKNSWVVHGPQNYERLTISGENEEKAYYIFNKLIGNKFKLNES